MARARTAPGAKKSERPTAARLKGIRALLLDCDGVLTTGDIVYDSEGRRILSFYARDGFGLAESVSE